MKIHINENPQLSETEIVINCRETDENLLKIVALLRTMDKKTFFYTKEEVYETPLKLYELEERLSNNDFFRAGKSTIINFNQIQSLRPDFGGRMIVQMSNGEHLGISRQYVLTIKSKLGL